MRRSNRFTVYGTDPDLTRRELLKSRNGHQSDWFELEDGKAVLFREITAGEPVPVAMLPTTGLSREQLVVFGDRYSKYHVDAYQRLTASAR